MAFVARAGKPVIPPTCFALISKLGIDSDIYIHTMHCDMEDTAKFGQLHDGDHDVADGGGILRNPQVRFYFEQSKKKEGYLHIRCGYNNKYWVAEESTEYPSDTTRAIGTTPQREEDTTKPLCTLFKVEFWAKDRKDDAGNNIYDDSFYDVHGRRACICANHRQNRESGIIGGIIVHNSFLIRDLSNHVVLPRHVAIKGDTGKYIAYGPHMHFKADDIADPEVMLTTFHNHNGTVRLQCNFNDRFLRHSGEKILADGNDEDKVSDMSFKVVKIDNYYGLLSIGAGKFCRRYTNHYFYADINQVTKEAKLQVEEAVLFREIYNVVYHGLDNARVYDRKTINMATSSAINCTSQSNSVKLSLTITQAQSNTWGSSVSVKAGVKTTFTAGIPGVASMSMEFSLEVTSENKWGTTEVNETKQEVIYEVVVPKMKKVTVSAIATQAKCDVPFSYTQKDVMPNGGVIITTHHDGIYTGMNTFNIQYETKEEDLPAPPLKLAKL